MKAVDARGSLRSRAELAEFFDQCDQREQAPEPDWEAHRAVIDRSKHEGLDVT